MAIRFGVLGGDLRNEYLAELLAADGFVVQTAELDAVSMEEWVADLDVLIGPTPCGEHEESEKALELMRGGTVFMAGRIDKRLMRLAKKQGILAVDLLEREELAVFNAIATAEGAIQVAMENMDITLHRSNILVLGNGRVGKILSKMLAGIGAEIYVAARKLGDLAFVESFGYDAVGFWEIEDFLGRMDLIVNTVPQCVLGENELRLVRREALIIELASKPYGVDFSACKQLGIKAVLAEGLPGKVAPKTSAEYLKNSVYCVLKEEHRM